MLLLRAAYIFMRIHAHFEIFNSQTTNKIELKTILQNSINSQLFKYNKRDDREDANENTSNRLSATRTFCTAKRKLFTIYK